MMLFLINEPKTVTIKIRIYMQLKWRHRRLFFRPRNYNQNILTGENNMYRLKSKNFLHKLIFSTWVIEIKFWTSGIQISLQKFFFIFFNIHVYAK